ncbi:MAG: endonuclease domain-containing protein [Acidiferrobacteraceae bacterium]
MQRSSTPKPVRESPRSRQLRYRYGISEAQYDQLLKLQGGVCAVCGRPPRRGVRLHVDHAHRRHLRTGPPDKRDCGGFVRGLACGYCNRRIIGRHRDGRLLMAAANYLDNPPTQRFGLDWKVPLHKKRRRQK